MNQLDAYLRKLPDGHIRYFYTDCVVERIYDGDTVSVLMNHGFGLKVERVSLRLFGLNAPEVRGEQKPQGEVTRDWLRDRIAPGAEFDRWGWITNGVKPLIDLQTVKMGRENQSRGKYGRYLALIWHKDGMNINWQMVDKGLAAIADY